MNNKLDLTALVQNAKKILETLDEGKSWTSTYITNRTEAAAFRNPGDVLIATMNDVVKKYASTSPIVTQKKFAELYNSLYKMSSKHDKFKSELGDLLFEKAAPQITVGASEKIRDLKAESEVDLRLQKAAEYEGFFSVGKKSLTAYSEDTVKKAEKFAKLQLASLGVHTQNVTAVYHNDPFILCKASVPTSDLTHVEVSIPVQVTAGIPALPEYFIDKSDSIVKLNKENIYVHIKDKQNFIKNASRRAMEGLRGADYKNIDTSILPAVFEKYPELEDRLVEASIKFSQDQVKMASNTVRMELISSGVTNPQLKVHSADANSIKFSASIPTARGRVDVIIPVEFSDNKVIMPAHFQSEEKLHKLNADSLSSFIKTAAASSIEKVSREYEAMERMTYDQLIDRMYTSVSDKDLKTASDALEVIQAKFDNGNFLNALKEYSKMLKHSSDSDERGKVVKAALASGTLIWKKNSVEPFCPKLGLPASKVGFDEKGRPYPLRRKITE